VLLLVSINYEYLTILNIEKTIAIQEPINEELIAQMKSTGG